MVANEFFIHMKGAVKLTVAFDKVEITKKFLSINTNQSLALLGYNFVFKNKINILISANSMLIQNV